MPQHSRVHGTSLEVTDGYNTIIFECLRERLEHSRNIENRLLLVFSTSPSRSQMAVMFYHSVIHGLGFFSKTKQRFYM